MSEEQLTETSLGDESESQEVEVVEQEEVEEVEDNAELETEEDSEEQPEAVDDSEELEFNQQKYKLPKTIAAAVRDMQKDYTVKTQAVAEQRKAFEAEVKFRQDNINEIADLIGMDKQIGQYKNLDWNTLNQNDPVMFQQLRLQYDEIKEARQNLAATLAQKHQTETLQKQQDIAKRMQESDAVLRREIKDWSSDKEQTLQSFAKQNYGFDSEDVIKAKANPALYKLLNDAYIGQQLLKKQTAKPGAVSKEVKPVTIVSGRGAKVATNPANMTNEQYMKWRKQGYK